MSEIKFLSYERYWSESHNLLANEEKRINKILVPAGLEVPSGASWILVTSFALKSARALDIRYTINGASVKIETS